MEEKPRDSSATASAAGQAPAAAGPAVETPPRRRSGALKRKAAAAAASNSGSGSPFSPPPAKRAAKEKKTPHSRPPVHNGPLTRARQTPNKFASSTVAASSSSLASSPQNPADTLLPAPAATATVAEPISATGEPIPAKEEPPAPDPIFIAEFEAIRSRDAGAHVVPIPAGWFSWTKIHPVEERSLPSFFNGKSEGRTPESYMEIRNEIMKKFHKDPQSTIELKDLSEMSVGDSDAKQQVMEFLDHWGLINFHPFPPQDSSAATVDEERASRTASLIEKLYHFEAVRPHQMERPDLASPALLPRLIPESAITDDLVGPEGPAVEYHCNSCSADCSRKRYHCQTQADFDLCSDCYNGGKFGSGMTSADFILMEHAEVPGASGGSWTDQETLLLLEALELYGENWSEIAEHVATKTRTQCILHFAQMPIEDSFLEGEDDDNASHHIGNVDPSPMNKDSSALGVTEKMETESKANEQQPVPSPVDISKPKDDGSQENMDLGSANKDVDPGPANKDSSSLQRDNTTVIKSITNEVQPDPCPTNVSKQKDATEVQVTQETGASFALNALKSAFLAVGSLSHLEGSLSFAEAGNPVMALASFLAGLVEPDVAAASTRFSLKSMSEDSPNIQLAARHCFLLEDPPNGKMDPSTCESAFTDVADEKVQKEEKQTSSLKVSDGLMTCTEKEAAPEDSLVTTKECKNELQISGSDDLALQDATPCTVNESSKSTLSGEVTPSTGKENSNTGLMEESPPKTVDIEDPNNSSIAKEVAPSIIKEPGDLVSQKEDAHCSPVTKAVDAVDMVPDSVSVEVEEPMKSVGSISTLEAGDIKGGNDTKMLDNESEINCTSTESKEDHNIDRIKRAAVTALSAAAVKAKLLAEQEEEQIREQIAMLIEKQLHKLETKLTLFTEMEYAIMRVREQLERARQRLYHERAQIIAARLGLPTPSSRPMPPSVPMSRTATNYANPTSKLPTMASQKPQVRKTLRSSYPPSSITSFPGTASGTSSRDQNQDTLSPIGPNTGS